LALAGEEVVIGSRNAARAQEAADRLMAKAPSARIHGDENQAAAQEGDVAFLTVPFAAQEPLLQQVGPYLRGKVVVVTVVPLEYVGGRPRVLEVAEGSAAMQAQHLLPQSRVVAAFHSVSAVDLLVPHRAIEGDVVVCADDREAKEQVMRLAERIQQLRAIDGGDLQNARYVEGLTALLLHINRIYKGRSMIKVVGIGPAP
ncbi:MAG: NADPH-dependent F420 reductase, partial [Dehalococcoidia bacterium]